MCGEPGALSATLRAARNVPVAVGVKVMETVQFPPIAMELPQLLLVMVYRPALVPVREMEVMASAAVPLLVSVTVCAAEAVFSVLAKESPVGLRLTSGPTAVPLKVTICVEPVTPSALSVTVTVAENVPVCVGAKVAVMVQVALAAREPAAQVLDSMNWSGLVPA